MQLRQDMFAGCSVILLRHCNDEVRQPVLPCSATVCRSILATKIGLHLPLARFKRTALKATFFACLLGKSCKANRNSEQVVGVPQEGHSGLE